MHLKITTYLSGTVMHQPWLDILNPIFLETNSLLKNSVKKKFKVCLETVSLIFFLCQISRLALEYLAYHLLKKWRIKE